MDTNLVNVKSASVWWCLHVLQYSNNNYAIFEAHFMKKSTNNEIELKKKVAYKKRVLINSAFVKKHGNKFWTGVKNIFHYYFKIVFFP